VAPNEAKKHHYVPQFYMRRFACADNENKVMVLERHRDVVVADRKSIEGIGYEERLHDYYDNGAPASIEGDLNKAIETPFSQSRTWSKFAAETARTSTRRIACRFMASPGTFSSAISERCASSRCSKPVT
jgi:Protein of unknown function (DUF4238)